MTTSYEHTQKAYPLVVILAFALILTAAGYAYDMVVRGPHTAYIIAGTFMCAVIAAVMIFLSSLTVQLDAGYLKIRFGLGLFRKKFPLQDIVSCKPVKNRWWYGYGIRIIPHGWLYNIYGLNAVELALKSGRIVRIGTDQPEKLAHAVNSALSE